MVRKPTTSLDLLPAGLAGALRRASRRRRTDRCAGWLLAGTASALAVFTAGILVDRAGEVAPNVRVVFPMVSALALAAGLGMALLVVFRRRRNWERLAGDMDSRIGGTDDTLRAAVNFAGRTVAGDRIGAEFLVRATLERADRLAAEANVRRLYPRRFARAAAVALAGAVLVPGLLSLLPGMPMELLAARFLDPYGNYPRPSGIRIVTSLPPTLRIEAGSDMTVEARLEGRVPPGPECFITVSDPAGGPVRRLAMQPRPNRVFQGVVRNVRSDFSFTLDSGSGRTARHEVRVVRPPAIVDIRASYRPPRYARIPPWTDTVAARELRALEGTVVTVDFTVDTPPAEASIVLETNPSGPAPAGAGDRDEPSAKWTGPGGDTRSTVRRPIPLAWDASGRRGRFTLTMAESGLLRIELAAGDGAANRYDPGYRVTVVPDSPPTIVVLNLPERITVRPDDVLDVRYLARDDLGLSDLEYRVTAADKSTLEEYIRMDSFGAREAEGAAAIPVREIAPDSRYVPAGGRADAVLDLALGAVDLKGQTAWSRRIQVTVLKETYDRQMDDLLATVQVLREITAANRKTLNSAVNGLTILRDSIGAEGAWSEAQQRRLDELAKLQLRPATTWNASQRLRAYRYSLYPYRFQRAADRLVCMLPLQDLSFARLSALGKGGDVRARLDAALRPLEARRDFLAAFAEAVDALERALAKDLLLYLAELARREGRAGASGGQEFQAMARERLAQRGTRAAALSAAIGPAGLAPKARAAADALRQASDAGNMEAIAAASEALVAALMADAAFTAEPDAVIEPRLAAFGDEWVLSLGAAGHAAGLADTPVSEALRVWQEYLDLAQDTTITNDAEMAALALAVARLRFGKADAPGALALRRSAAPDAAACELAMLAGQAYEYGRLLADGLASGRLTLRDAETEDDWVRMRDAVLVLCDRAAAGAFGEAGQRGDALAALPELRLQVLRWDYPDLWADRARRAALVRAVDLLGRLAGQGFGRVASGRADSAAWLREMCALLADAFALEREDALARMRALQEEAGRPPASPGLPADRAPATLATSAYGEAKEAALRQYALLHRKALDFHEMQAILRGRADPAALAAQAAVVEYLWWLANDVMQGFGRYHGPSVVRRHHDTPQSYLTRMKDYPANLDAAAAAFRRLSATPAGGPETEALAARAHAELRLKAQAEAVAAMREAVAQIRTGGPPLSQLLARPASGPWLAERIAIPCRRLLEEGRAASEPAAWRADAAEVVFLLAACAVNTGGAERPGGAERIRGAERARAVLEPLAAGRVAPPTPEGDAAQELAAAVGEVVESLGEPLRLPPVAVRQSKRMNVEAMLNDLTYPCRERTERLWQEEAGWQQRFFERACVDGLVRRAQTGSGDADAARVAARFACARMAARKSAGVQREAGSELDIVIPGLSYDLLAMPRHLYDELLRAKGEPYPEQFKDRGLGYIRGLLEDARR